MTRTQKMSPKMVNPRNIAGDRGRRRRRRRRRRPVTEKGDSLSVSGDRIR